MKIRTLAKRLANALFGRYQLNRIYTIDLEAGNPRTGTSLTMRLISDAAILVQSRDAALSDRAWAAGDNAYGYGLWKDGELACMCWFWDEKRFTSDRIWRLIPGEAIMVELVTVEKFRGQGLAPALIDFACEELRERRFRRLFTWVWHSNHPSIKAFEKAGWTYIAFVAELFPFRSRRSLRLSWTFRERSPRT